MIRFVDTVREAGHEDDGGAKVQIGCESGDFNAAHVRHVDVQQDYSRLQAFDHRESLEAVIGRQYEMPLFP